MREDDGVKYGLLEEASRGQVMRVFLAAAYEVYISNLFLSLMLGICVLS